MKKVLTLLPVLLGILACGTLPLPTQNNSNGIHATLTAIHRNNLQNIATQPILTSISDQVMSLGLHYYWPQSLPAGFEVNPSYSNATANGFSLEFINPATGTLDIVGGEYANQHEYCTADSIPQVVRGFNGCFPQSSGGGFSVQWKEENVAYSVGGFGLSREAALQIAEQLEALDIYAWQERLNQ